MSTAAYSWDLWSTRAKVVVTDRRMLDEAVARSRLLLDEVDDAANRFRPDSEISTLHDRTRAGMVRVSPMLADLLRTALRAAEQTGGAVDPTVGRALEDAGYERDIRLVTDAGGAPTRAVPAPGWRTLALEDDVLTLPAEVRLDLGATAKARAADLVAAHVARTLDVGVLVCLGGDVATAGRSPIGSWQVAVRDAPEDPETQVTLSGGWAVATSSTVQRRWTCAGRPVHHIVDPATGRSAEPVWHTVTVAAASCADANTASTAAVVLGESAPAWLGSRGLQARLVDAGGRVHRVGGWPSERRAA